MATETQSIREANSRAEAKALGLTRYFTGKPCKHGHVAHRYASTGQCSVCVTEFKQRYGNQSERAREGCARRNKRWIDRTKVARAQKGREWRQKNADVVRAYTLNRRALRQRATPIWFGELDELVMREASDLARLREASTGFPWHADHAVPIKCRKASGLHCAANIQVIPAAMNTAKGNKLILLEPFEWLTAL